MSINVKSIRTMEELLDLVQNGSQADIQAENARQLDETTTELASAPDFLAALEKQKGRDIFSTKMMTMMGMELPLEVVIARVWDMAITAVAKRDKLAKEQVTIQS